MFILRGLRGYRPDHKGSKKKGAQTTLERVAVSLRHDYGGRIWIDGDNGGNTGFGFDRGESGLLHRGGEMRKACKRDLRETLPDWAELGRD